MRGKGGDSINFVFNPPIIGDSLRCKNTDNWPQALCSSKNAWGDIDADESSNLERVKTSNTHGRAKQSEVLVARWM